MSWFIILPHYYLRYQYVDEGRAGHDGLAENRRPELVKEPVGSDYSHRPNFHQTDPSKLA
jgi:hypothetical protein